MPRTYLLYLFYLYVFRNYIAIAYPIPTFCSILLRYPIQSRQNYLINVTMWTTANMQIQQKTCYNIRITEDGLYGRNMELHKYIINYYYMCCVDRTPHSELLRVSQEWLCSMQSVFVPYKSQQTQRRVGCCSVPNSKIPLYEKNIKPRRITVIRNLWAFLLCTVREIEAITVVGGETTIL
jgi:hypothetical protein